VLFYFILGVFPQNVSKFQSLPYAWTILGDSYFTNFFLIKDKPLASQPESKAQTRLKFIKGQGIY
jgi:hypothetical protein